LVLLVLDVYVLILKLCFSYAWVLECRETKDKVIKKERQKRKILANHIPSIKIDRSWYQQVRFRDES
jgi:hypothetical protein